MRLRLRPILALTGLAGIGGGTIFAKNNDLDFNSIGLIRFGRAAYAAAAISYDYQKSIYMNKNLPDDDEEVQKIWSEVHKRSAHCLLDLCKANRGVFIKVGQHLAALDYLLPQEYLDTLKILHSQAPESPIEDVFSVIKEDLKVDKDKLFSEFDPIPIGTASLAQVYKAKLLNGDEVAVKVQHKKVRAHSYVDMKTMEILVKLADWAFPDFKLLWLVAQTKENLPKELDFLYEAANTEKIKMLLQHVKWLKVPKVYCDYLSKRIIVMEYCEGGQVNDVNYIKKNNISPYEVTSKLGELYSEMIFKLGFIHADPHPGNVLIRKDKKFKKLEICLIDHGLYAILSDEYRLSYANFWLSVINSDVEGIKKYSTELNVGEYYTLFSAMITARSWNTISSKEGITGKKISLEEQKLIQQSIGKYAKQISEVLDRIPPPLVLIFKTNDLLRGIESTLGTQKTMASFTTITKYCVNAKYEDKFKKCANLFCEFKVKFAHNFILFRITVLEFYLWIKSFIFIL